MTYKNKQVPLSVHNLVLCSMFVALLTIISQISIPMPVGIPITIQIYGVALTGVILGWKSGFFTVFVYILLGACGLPVFANFHGGISSLMGMTGGYIWGWLLMVLFCGYQPNPHSRIPVTPIIIASAVIGLLIDEFLGGLQWAFLSNSQTFHGIFLYSITAFIPKDIILTVLAVLSGLKIKNLLSGHGISI